MQSRAVNVNVKVHVNVKVNANANVNANVKVNAAVNVSVRPAGAEAPPPEIEKHFFDFGDWRQSTEDDHRGTKDGERKTEDKERKTTGEGQAATPGNGRRAATSGDKKTASAPAEAALMVGNRILPGAFRERSGRGKFAGRESLSGGTVRKRSAPQGRVRSPSFTQPARRQS